MTETHDEQAAEDAAMAILAGDLPLTEREVIAFRAAWSASRAYQRRMSEREIAEAQARMLERRGWCGE